jgi:7-cyano-7-deazaguanine synthase in queuosine biosynthesis
MQAKDTIQFCSFDFRIPIYALSADEMREVAKSEMTDLRRAIGQEQFEKEAVQKTANDLRNMVMKAESEKTELCRFIQDERQKIGGK